MLTGQVFRSIDSSRAVLVWSAVNYASVREDLVVPLTFELFLIDFVPIAILKEPLMQIKEECK
jgi:hypothetical protein